MSKKQRNARKIFTKVMCAMLAVLMLLGTVGTLMFYLIAM